MKRVPTCLGVSWHVAARVCVAPTAIAAAATVNINRFMRDLPGKAVLVCQVLSIARRSCYYNLAASDDHGTHNRQTVSNQYSLPDVPVHRESATYASHLHTVFHCINIHRPPISCRRPKDVPMPTPILFTIQNLESLAADFAIAVQSAAGRAPLPPEIRVRKEALLTIRVLLAKLNEVETLSSTPIRSYRPGA